MHTAMVISGGLVLLGILCLMLPTRATAAKVFIPVWLVASVANLWIGVSRAGYTVAQEAPILAVVFGVPALVAVVIWWQSRR